MFQVQQLLDELDALIRTETVRARHIQLVRVREQLAILACDPES